MSGDKHDRGLKRTHRLSVRPRSAAESEFEFINRIQRRTAVVGRGVGGKVAPPPFAQFSHLLQGIGDDAAIVRTGPDRDSLLTADLLVEDIDFRRAWLRPQLLGHKALAVSLSDIAAMGANPCWALLSLGVPNDIWSRKFLDEFYDGFFSLAEAHGVALIGGDVSRTPERIVVDSIVWGEAKRRRAVLRSGARPGDRIYVTGSLGGAAAGLQLLEAGARVRPGAVHKAPRDERAHEQLIFRHLRPSARVAWGRLLGEKRLATAMIDVSDGLSSDLAHLCRASRVGARIDASRLPVDPLIERARRQQPASGTLLTPQFDAFALALNGGEDYELLFAVSPHDVARLPDEVDGVAVTYIGDVTDEAGKINLIDGKRARSLKPSGFSHFRAARRKELALPVRPPV